MDDPARQDPGSGSLLDLFGPIQEVWNAIDALISERVDAAIRERLLNSTEMTNVAVTMGTPGVALTASAQPWAHVVIPFYAIIYRIDYFRTPAGGSAAIDVRVVRPGQGVGDASTFYPGAPPSFTEDVTRVMTSSDWQGYVEPGSALLFYVTSASGVDLVTANVILRTIGGS